MEAKKPLTVPTYDNVEKEERTGRDVLCYEFYCEDCGYIFGSINASQGTPDYTMKRLAKMDCEKCGGRNWAYRDVMD